MAGAVVLSAFLFFGCGGQNKQKTEKEMNADTIKGCMHSGKVTERQPAGYADAGRYEGDMDS